MRLFVSIPLPQIQREHLQRALVGGRTTNPEQWHLTLAFLGDRDDDLDLTDALSGIVAPSFSLSVAGAGSFPGVEWAGLSGDLDALQQLASQVAKACRVQQAVYRPHITIARRGRAQLRQDYVGPAWTVEAFDLVHSTLGTPVEHDVLASFPLR